MSTSCGWCTRSKGGSSGSSRAFQNGGNRLGQDLKIQPQRSPPDVIVIEFHPSFEWNEIPSVDLPQTCYARTHTETSVVPIRYKCVVVAIGERPRTDEAHVPF